MSMSLHNDCAAIAECRTLEDLQARVTRAAENLGFPLVSLSLHDEQPNGRFQSRILAHNVPAAYMDAWKDTSKGRSDPTTKITKRTSLPLVWNRTFYAEHGALDLWREQAPHGYEEGVLEAAHLPGGRHFAFGVDSPAGRLPTQDDRLIAVVAEVHLLAAHCIAAADRILPLARPAEMNVELTPREREALGWTLAGKTAWEVGVILGVAERTAVAYLASASRKLGCSSKHQAAIRASHLGLITA